jgi:hypothetical protein
VVSAARLSALRKETPALWPPAALDAPPLEATALLTAGGDSRIEPDEVSGLNRYGCGARPNPDIAPFGSSTASTISTAAHGAVQRLAHRLTEDCVDQPRPVVYRQELGRIRHKIAAVLGLGEVAGLKTILSPSGTDLHRIALHIAAAGAASPPLVVMPEPQETGSGIVAALGGQVGPTSALRVAITSRNLDAVLAAPQIVCAPSRAADGTPRPAHEIDEEVSVIVSTAARMGRRVLLVLMDVSKTGLISPSVACAEDLKSRFPDQVEVMVDACQLRLAPATLAAYLGQQFMVAITGSKFMTGPAFSAALLAPASVAERLRAFPRPRALAGLCARGEWPEDLAGAVALDERENFGLLARWEAALEEMRRFSLLPSAAVQGFFSDFAEAIGERLADDDAFEPIVVRPLERTGLGAASSWDRIQTIFPFALRAGGRLLTPVETVGVQRLLGVDLGDWSGWAPAARQVELGQPVQCGVRGETPLTALRICMSARLASTALCTGGPGGAGVIAEALDALDKTAWLAGRLAES